jgi:hypothetical protein
VANDRPRIAPWPGDGAAPRAEALSNVYRFILECRAKRKAAESSSDSKGYNTASESWRNPSGTPLEESAP